MLDANPFAAVQQAGGPGIEQALPLAMDQLVHHRLRLGQIIDAHEAVVALLEADARPLHMRRASCSLDWLLLDR
jgi:hypothetical protein